MRAASMLHRAPVLFAAAALSGCSLVFPDSSYTGGTGPIDAAVDAAEPDGAIDAGELDAGNEDDGGPPVDGGPPDDGGVPGRWPTCGNGDIESSIVRDARGVDLELGDAFFGALFGGSSAAAGEAGLIADQRVPPAPAPVVDIAIASGTGSAFVLATGDEDGGLLVREISLAGSLSFGAPLAVAWPGDVAPTSIERIAMRTVGGVTRIAVIGSSTAEPMARAWSCTVEGARVVCTSLAIDSSASAITTAAVFGTAAGVPDTLLLGHDEGGGVAMRPADGTTPVVNRGYVPGDRVSGTGGPLVIASVLDGGDPFAYWLGVAGFTERDLGPRSGPAAAVFLGPDTFAMAQAQLDGPGTAFTLGVRPLTCNSTECLCPGEASDDCGGTAAFSSRMVGARDPRFVELERAGDALLAIVGEGDGPASLSGTEVVLYAFDRMSSTPIDLGPSAPSMVLGSGMGAPAFVGTLVPGYGMRTAIRSGASEVVLLQAALVDLEAGSGVTREVFVSALRLCRAR